MVWVRHAAGWPSCSALKQELKTAHSWKGGGKKEKAYKWLLWLLASQPQEQPGAWSAYSAFSLCFGKQSFTGYYFFIWIQTLWAFGREINNSQPLRWRGYAQTAPQPHTAPLGENVWLFSDGKGKDEDEQVEVGISMQWVFM